MAAPREYSGKGFILGGVTDETPDWLGSYDEGVQGAQQQTTTRLNQRETRQRMGQNDAEEARRAQRFGWEADDRLREEERWATTDGKLPGLQTQPGPALGPMDPVNLPEPIAPSPGLMTEPVAGSNQPDPLSRQAFLDMLPEWAGFESQAGLPPGFLERTAMLESSNGTNFREGSQYIGIFQIGAGVAKDFNVTPEQLKDPRVNAQVAAKLAARNLRQLREGLGREPQPWELYLAHQQGAGGALALLRSPNQSAVEALTAAHGGDRTKAIEIITANGGNPQMTAGQFAQVWAKKYGGGVGVGSSGGIKDVPAIPGAQGQASRPGRMDSGTARLPFMPNTPKAEPVIPTEQEVAGGKGNLAPGLTIPPDAQPLPPTPAAPAAPAAPGQVSINANGVPVTGAPAAPQQAGLQTEPAPLGAPTGEVMPRVSREDFAGIQQPGQGSIGQQIMRTPAGQQAVLPDMGAYIVEPAKIGAELFEMQQMRDELQRQYAEAVKFRDRATMIEIRNKDVQLRAATRMLGNLQSVAKMQAGDDNAMAQELSRMTGGRLRIQPVQPNGTYNVFYDGRMIYENVSKDAFMAALRSEFDAQYQAQVAELKKLRDERETKLFEGQIEESKEITKQKAIMYKDVAIEQLKRSYPVDASVNFDATTGRLVVVPDGGRGQPEMWEVAPVMGTNGQPVEDGAGNQKMELRRVNTAGSSVPTQ
jgi:hypothetical protein